MDKCMRFEIKKNAQVFFLVPFLVFALIDANAQSMYVHDPVIIREGEKYHLYCTFQGIASFESSDLSQWKYTGPVFKKIPQWTYEAVPDFKGHIWAPDIVYHNGLYYIYYSISSFEKNTSCIGVATNITLDTADADYHWEDHGIVVQSVPGRDLWNAIDPNIAFDKNGNVWMSFGSFWQGLKLVKLDSTLLRIENPEQWYTIAKRNRSYDIPDHKPGDGAIEAPFIFKKHGYYYLFVSFDFCCRGVESNYKIMVGRSEEITGPYLDKEGKDMFVGGGSLVLTGDEKFSGVGHNSAYTFDGTDYLICHAYDVEDDGRPVLLIMKMEWDEDLWPLVKKESKLNCSIIK